ncbi:MAG: hydantoinase/oxoprolinase family protein [Gammaproteobacteria bacterium]
MSTETSYRIGVDIGGTFTDIVLLASDGALHTKKVPSTPDDYGRGIIDGIGALLTELAIAPTQIAGIVHATTVATNTILEFKGARTALITTEGFRDVLEMRRLRIPELYNLQYEKPAPLVARRHRFEIRERLGPNGEVWQPLDEASVEAIVPRLRDAGIEALAICLLHSYANPSHERRVAEMLRDALGDDVYITCSVEVLPEIREYERTSTTVVNAYIGAVVKAYLTSLVRRLAAAGLRAPVAIMQSNGGIMTAAAAIAKPAYIVESGPAAGVIACARLARLAGHENIISLDMGGTTAKAAMVENGEPAKTSEYEVGAGINLSSKLVKGGGYPIKLPFIDVSEIGAGGGSILRVDDSGLLKVGPDSAGAAPGPACYGLGGDRPTLTDALVVLGYLNPRHLVGGSVKLDAERARRALAEQIAGRLGKSPREVAWGALLIAVATMTRAVKAVTTYRGRDPRDFALLAFGGNGPMAAAMIAHELRMRRVLVPPAPGVFSALGLLFCEPEREFVQTLFRRGSETSAAAVEAAYRGLEDEAAAALLAEGYGREQIALRRFADLRYAGQAYELTVTVAPGVPDMEIMARAFGAEHLRTYGHKSDTDPVDLINIKVMARASLPAQRRFNPSAGLAAGARAVSGEKRDAYFGPKLGILTTPVGSRADLTGRVVAGPFIIEEYDATCVIPPGCSAALDALGNIDITVGDVMEP